MSESLTIAQGQVQHAANHTQVVEWSYDIYTREFECDQPSMANAFGFKRPINCLDDLLEQLSIRQQDASH
ncbi:hypothetical protein, partial [Vibrio sp. 704]|uniref:hypothetical protein n=1 Tax=Vibrio sp. 704 TaxID=3074610 RepID=UPI002963D229